MTTAYDVSAGKLIAEAAAELRKTEAIQPPAWVPFVKTGVCRERPPDNPDWWFTRVASILRKVYLEGPIGIRHLRKQYGGKRNVGARPHRVYPGSGSITRKALQQLESAGLIKKAAVGKKSLGRQITPAGQKFVDAAAYKAKKAE